jgi:hypothetical protein
MQLAPRDDVEAGASSCKWRNTASALFALTAKQVRWREPANPATPNASRQRAKAPSMAPAL